MTDRALFESLLLIRSDPRFAALRDWLASERAAAMKYMIHTNEDRALSVAQGDVRRLDKILDLIAQSPALLNKGAPRQGAFYSDK